MTTETDLLATIEAQIALDESEAQLLRLTLAEVTRRLMTARAYIKALRNEASSRSPRAGPQSGAPLAVQTAINAGVSRPCDIAQFIQDNHLDVSVKDLAKSVAIALDLGVKSGLYVRPRRGVYLLTGAQS